MIFCLQARGTQSWHPSLEVVLVIAMQKLTLHDAKQCAISRSFSSLVGNQWKIIKFLLTVNHYLQRSDLKKKFYLIWNLFIHGSVLLTMQAISILLVLWGLFSGFGAFWCQITFISWSIILLSIARHMRLVCLLLDNWWKVITFWLANEVRLDVLPINHCGRSRKFFLSSKSTCVCLFFNFQMWEIMNVKCFVATWSRECQLIKR